MPWSPSARAQYSTLRAATPVPLRLDIERRSSGLHPGEPLGLPARETPPVVSGIEWPLESLNHIAAAGKARLCHRPRSLEASAAGATDEEQSAFFACADGHKGFGDASDELVVLAVVRILEPFDQHRPLSDRGQIRHAYERPLRCRPDIDQ